MNKVRHDINEEIDLGKVIRTIWDSKFLIVITILFFAGVGYYYGIKQPIIYESKVTLRIPKKDLFGKYYNFFYFKENGQMSSPAKLYFKELHLLLVSRDNLNSFKKKNNYKSNLSFRGPALNTDQTVKVYTLTFQKPLDAKKFLNDYILYTSEISLNELKRKIEYNLQSQIIRYDEAIEIAENISEEFEYNSKEVNNSLPLYSRNIKVLNIERKHLNKKMESLKNIKVSYNPIFDSPTGGSSKGRSINSFVFYGVILGSFLSLFIVFIRYNLKRS